MVRPKVRGHVDEENRGVSRRKNTGRSFGQRSSTRRAFERGTLGYKARDVSDVPSRSPRRFSGLLSEASQKKKTNNNEKMKRRVTVVDLAALIL